MLIARAGCVSAQPWAGKAGARSRFRIGQEVVVSFLEGDPDRPIVVGSVYNGASKDRPQPAGQQDSEWREDAQLDTGHR